MPWKINFFFYLTLGFSLVGFIFPTHMSQAIGFDIGDMFFWVYGFYILMPRNPVGEPRLYFNFQGFFLLISAIILLSVYSIQMRKAKLNGEYSKNLVYIVAIVYLFLYISYESTVFAVLQLSSWAFLFSGIFAIMGNRELKIYYINENKVNTQKEKIIGIVLLVLSLHLLLYFIPMILINLVPFGLNYHSLFFITAMFPELFIQLIILFYGIFSLIRANKQSRS